MGKQAIRARDLNPGPTKRLWCKGRGSNPGFTKKMVLQGQGFESWTYQKRSCVQSCTLLLIWLRIWSWEQACVRKHAQNAQTSSTWNMFAGWWMTARPANNCQTNQKWMTDCSKNDASVEKDMFPAEHIFFKVPHHVPINVDFYRLNQPTARCM